MAHFYLKFLFTPLYGLYQNRRQINLREYFSYLEMLIEKEKLNLYDVVEIEYLIARLIEYDIFLQRSILRGLLIF